MQPLVLLGLLLGCCAAAASGQSDITGVSEMLGLTDQQLAAIYANPAVGNPEIPGISTPNSFTFCSGLTYINFFTNGTNSLLKGPFSGGAANPLNKFAASVWLGKIFEVNSQGQAALWNVLFNNSTVAVTANVVTSPVGLQGSQVRPMQAKVPHSVNKEGMPVFCILIRQPGSGCSASMWH